MRPKTWGKYRVVNAIRQMIPVEIEEEFNSQFKDGYEFLMHDERRGVLVFHDPEKKSPKKIAGKPGRPKKEDDSPES